MAFGVKAKPTPSQGVFSKAWLVRAKAKPGPCTLPVERAKETGQDSNWQKKSSVEHVFACAHVCACVHVSTPVRTCLCVHLSAWACVRGCACVHLRTCKRGGERMYRERAPPVTLREKMSFPRLCYIKETIKTELSCQPSGKTSKALFQIKATQGRTLSEWVCLRDLAKGERA